jgi:uncharacterized protein (DUF697 family)
MSLQIAKQLRGAIANLNPGHVRELAERPLDILLVATSSAAYARMEDFFAPAGISRAKRIDIFQMLHRASDPAEVPGYDLEIYEEGIDRPQEAFTFYPQQPEFLVDDILYRREELGLPLARHFPPFRPPVVNRIINSISQENAVFSVVTALPDIVPSLLELPWALGEFASDTAFLTANQLRMAFLLAAASDRPVGYHQQKGEVASIVGGAFGWRALARNLVGKIPLGGGIIPKAAIAFAVTYVMGRSLERLYRVGYGLTRAERRLTYSDALQTGKALVAGLLHKPGGAG